MDKICSICKVSKELTDENFHKDKGRAHGFMYNCKPCVAQRGAERRLRNPRKGEYGRFTQEQKDAYYIRSRRYLTTEKGRALALSSSYKHTDNKKGYQNDITKEDILEARQNGVCFYCGDTPSGFDRIDNEKGHTKENCVPCCKECNVSRMDNFSHKEMMVIGEAIRQVKEMRNTEGYYEIDLSSQMYKDQLSYYI